MNLKFEEEHKCLHAYVPNNPHCDAGFQFRTVILMSSGGKVSFGKISDKCSQNQCFIFRHCDLLSDRCVYVSDSFHISFREVCGAVVGRWCWDQVQTPLQSTCRCVPGQDTSPQMAPVVIVHSIEYVSRFG